MDITEIKKVYTTYLRKKVQKQPTEANPYQVMKGYKKMKNHKQ